MLLLDPYRFASAFQPDDISGLTAWYSSLDSADYTKSGSEITQLNDKSGNANHLTVPATKTGPDEVTINGVTWMDFPVAGGRVLSGTNTAIDPDAGDFTFACVYRAVDSSNGPGCVFGKIGAGNHNFGIFNGISNSRSLYFQMRDSGLTTQLVEHDDAGTDYTDGTTRFAMVTYDDSEADLFLYGSDFSSTVATDITAPTGDVTPTNDLFLGDWSTSYNRAHEGEILCVVAYNKVLNGTERTQLQTYFEGII